MSERPWPSLTPMARIEVVVDGAQVPAVKDVLAAAGARGWTLLPGVSGLGHHGEHTGRLLFNDHHTLSLLISVVPSEQVEPVVAALRRILDDHHGVVFVSETHVSREDHFR